MKQQHVMSFGRLTHPARLILVSLYGHPMDGSELLTSLEDARTRLEPGTLWAALSRLERAGLISPWQTDSLQRQTRRYEVTDAGLSAIYQERSALFVSPDRSLQRAYSSVWRTWMLLVITWIIRLYPPAWRERYEQEMRDLLATHPITLRTWLDLLLNALDARFDPFYRRSAPLSPFRQLRRVQGAILVAVLLPLFSAVFWVNLFSPIGGGLRNDYWTRNEHYLILALIHELGSLGVNVTIFCALLVCIQFAYQGIKRFGRPGDALWHRLIAVVMHLPVVIFLLSFFPPLFQQEAVGNTILVIYIPLISLLLTSWGVVRREAFRRAFLYLLPWLSLHLFVPLFVLTLVLGQLLSTLGVYTGPPFMPIALVALVSAPVSFVVALVRLRLGKQLRTILLRLATVGTLSMTLVQLMMAMRLLVLHFLGLSTIWTSELIIELILNVLCTALALVFLLTLRLLRRRKIPLSNAGEEWVVMPLS